MKTTILVPVLGSLLLSSPVAMAEKTEAEKTEAENTGSAPPRRDFCYAPGTPQEVVERHAARSRFGQLAHSLSGGGIGKARLTDRWTSTATDGFVPSQGTPLTLTWSVPPDGTLTHDINGADVPSDLRAFLNSIYGSETAWRPIIQEVFDRWSELTGITYVFEHNDDGAPLPSNNGLLGVRGDVRLSGTAIDGNFGILAFNYFPNSGDMVLDTSDSFYTNTSNDSLRLRNTLSHEHGHGLGMSHVCPVEGTKLMEPFLTTGFDGPQHDDILAGQRGYGDPAEDNDSTTSPAAWIAGLGQIPLSIDDDSDLDVYSFAGGPGDAVSVTVQPVGFEYLEGPQTGSCSSGSLFDSSSVHDLSIRILGPDGNSELAQADATGRGFGETLQNIALTMGTGTYYIEVSGDATSSVQLYEIELDTTIADPDHIFSSGFGDESNGQLHDWSMVAP